MNLINRLEDDLDENRVYECPICHTGKVRINSELFYGRCNNCKATLIDYQPLAHQEAFHASTAQYRLNIGGFGSGKCVLGTTRVATEQGYISIKDLFANPAEGFNDFKIKVHTNKGLKDTSHFYYEKNCKVNVLKLANGSEVNGTDKHKVLVLRGTKPEMVRMDSIEVGDTLLFRGIDNTIKTTKGVDYFYTLGAFLGDGFLNKNKKGIYDSYGFCGTYADVENFKRITGITGKIVKDKRRKDLYKVISWVSDEQIFSHLGYVNSGNKYIPEEAYRASEEEQFALLSGLLDTDGYAHDNYIDWTFKSKRLVDGIADILDLLGIDYYRTNKTAGYGTDFKGNYYRLTTKGVLPDKFIGYKHYRLTKKDSKNVRHIIDLGCSYKEVIRGINRMRDFKGKRHADLGHTTAKNVKATGKITKRTLQKLIDFYGCESEMFEELLKYNFIKVVDKSTVIDDVYDLTVPDGHLFMAQGLLNHNTTAACAEIAIQAVNTPHGRSLITAPTLTLIKDAVIPELERFLPKWLIAKSRLSPSPYYKLKNGHEIICYSSKDPQKLRSLNLTAFYIEEASGVNYSIFDVLMTRLRHPAGIIRDRLGKECGYKFMGIVSTNPEDGWILDKFLLISHKLVASPSIDVNEYKKAMKNHLSVHFESFISSTRDNNHVPRQFIELMSAGKSANWIKKYVDCVINVSEDAVYPDYDKCLEEPFDIPKTWLRIGGFDPGFRDPTACPIAAIDPKTGIIHVYEDYEVAEKPVGYHSKEITKLVKGFTFLYPIQADPSISKRNDRDGISYKDYFYKHSKISMESANNDIMFGIEKVRDYIDSGKLKFFNNLENLIYEFRNYKYEVKEAVNTSVTPKDKNNHLMDALRYMIVKLPQDPTDMVNIFVRDGYSVPVSSLTTNLPNDYEDEMSYANQGICIGFRKL